MFDNIGRKFKNIATYFCVCGIILSVIYGFICFFDKQLGVLQGLLGIVLGSAASWLSSCGLYALGEVVENIQNINTQLLDLKKELLLKDVTNTQKSEPNHEFTHIITAPQAKKVVSSGHWICPTCGSKNLNSTNSCNNCGQKLKVCPNCGKKIPSEASICPECNKSTKIRQGFASARSTDL